MRLLQVTLTSAATPIIPKAVLPANSLPFQVFLIQNNSAHAIRVGDYTVSMTVPASVNGGTAGKGILIEPGSPGGSQELSPGLEYTGDMTEFYIAGTATDVIDVMVLD